MMALILSFFLEKLSHLALTLREKYFLKKKVPKDGPLLWVVALTLGERPLLWGPLLWGPPV